MTLQDSDAFDLLRIEDLRVSFTLQGQAHEVLNGVSLRVRPGSVVALVGESGSGKSVTAQAAMGLLPRNGHVTGGRACFHDPENGRETTLTAVPRDGPEMRSIRGARISMIFQEPMNSLSPLHTIGDQVSEVLTIHERIDRRTARERTVEMLAHVGFPDPKAAFDRYAFELSGGLRQRAMIAMALIGDPALLIADEPTTALDVTRQAQVLALLKRLRRERDMALLLITHDLGVVANIADEVVVMYHGEIMEAGGVEDIFRRPRHTYLKALMGAVPHFDMKPGERLMSLQEHGKRPDVSGAAMRPIPIVDCTTPLLSVRNLSKSFVAKSGSWFSTANAERVQAVDGVSFDIRRGECLGLVGESGCGKTTLSKMIMRALKPDSGEIVLTVTKHGTSAEQGDTNERIDLARLDQAALAAHRHRVQMVFQDPAGSLSPRMTILNILREPMAIAGQLNGRQQVARCVELMETVGLDPRFLGRYPHSFSGGQRQRIGIARALAMSPDLLICDEPVSALDVSVQARILNLLNDLRAAQGLTYLFISHNLAVVDYVADRIAVMARGRIVELAPREALFARPTHPYTRALLRAVPYPDLDRPLDFQSLEASDGANERDWPAVYRATVPPGRDDDGSDLVAHEIGTDHLVLARPSASRAELMVP